MKKRDKQKSYYQKLRPFFHFTLKEACSNFLEKKYSLLEFHTFLSSGEYWTNKNSRLVCIGF